MADFSSASMAVIQLLPSMSIREGKLMRLYLNSYMKFSTMYRLLVDLHQEITMKPSLAGLKTSSEANTEEILTQMKNASYSLKRIENISERMEKLKQGLHSTIYISPKTRGSLIALSQELLKDLK